MNQSTTIHLVLAALSLLLCLRTQAQAPAFDRAVTCASGQGNYGWGPKKLVTDSQGNTYVTGTFSGTITLGSSTLTASGMSPGPGLSAPPDMFVAKLDVAGSYVWATAANGTLYEDVTGLAVDTQGDVYVTGYFESFSLSFGGGGGPVLFNSSARSEGYVAQLNGTTGQWQWARRFGGTREETPAGVAINAQGEVYVAGNSGSTVADFGPFILTNTQFGDAFIAKLSPTGTWLWAQQAGSGRPTIRSLVLDGQGDLYLAGTFGAPSVSFGNTLLTTQVISGSSSLTGAEVFVAKYTDAGAWAWAVQGDAVTHSNLISRGYSVGLASDRMGHIYITGGYSNQSVRLGNIVLPNLSVMVPQPNPLPPVPYTNNYYSDAYVARLDAGTGAWQWAVRTGGGQQDGIDCIVADGQGRVYVGSGISNVLGFDNPLPGGGRVQLAQLDGATGAWRWALPLPSAVARELALDNVGRVYVVGYFDTPTVTFGANTLVSAGAGLQTGYMARLGAGPLATRPVRAGNMLEVWPNPSRAGAVSIQGPKANERVDVLDALGRLVRQGQMPGSGPLSLQVAGLPAGLYVVRGGGQVQRLVVED